MMYSLRNCLLPLVFLFTACSTSYQREGFSGGYSEIITNPDSFIVTFSGNSSTSHETALRYALLRASELTLQQGYKYFVVTSSEDRSSSYEYSTTYNDQSGNKKTEVKPKKANTQYQESGSSSTYTGTVVKPRITLRIQCYLEKPEAKEVFDAEFYWAMNKVS